MQAYKGLRQKCVLSRVVSGQSLAQVALGKLQEKDAAQRSDSPGPRFVCCQQRKNMFLGLEKNQFRLVGPVHSESETVEVDGRLASNGELSSKTLSASMIGGYS